MSDRYRLHPRAREEFFEAAEWYERELPGLGSEFQARIEEAIESIMDLPLAAPLWPGLATLSPVRRKLVRQFKDFAVAYVLGDHEGLDENDTIFIVAIANLRRRPGYWLDRLPP